MWSSRAVEWFGWLQPYRTVALVTRMYLETVVNSAVCEVS